MGLRSFSYFRLHFRSHFKSHLHWVSGLVLSASLGTAAAPAQALPGQSLNSVMQWSQRHSILRPLRRDVAPKSGQPFYISETKTEDGTMLFSVSPTDITERQVGRETIAYWKKSRFPNFVFTKVNKTGANLIRRVYDRSLVNDFYDSALVAQVDFTAIEMRFYRGQRFAYATVKFKQPNRKGERFSHFSVLPLRDLENEIASARQCRTSGADGCDQ